MRHPAFIFRGSLLACALALACVGSTGEPGTGTGGDSGGGTSGTAGMVGTAGTVGTGGSSGSVGTAGTVGPGTAGTTGTGGGTAGSGGNVGSAGSAGSGTAGSGAAGTTGGRGGAAGSGTAGAGGRGGAAGAGTAGRGGAAGTAGAGGRGGAAGSGTAGTTGTAGATGTGGCTTPPAAGPMVGWATLGGSTTGGGTTATPQVVTTLQQFTSAVQGNTAAIIYVNGKLAAGRVGIGQNKTIVGLCGAELHGHLSIGSNVILRNIKVVGYGVGDCSLDPNYDPGVGCSSGDDAITISGSQHVWVDHCDISDGTDGNLDINTGADYITVSWTKFHYTPRTDPTGNDNTGAEGHRFSNLIGSADNVPQDSGHLNITWDHDWWADNVNQRMPRSRAGKIHVLNSLYTAAGDSYCTNAGQGAQLLVEGTAYIGVKAPFQVTMTGILNAPAGSNYFMGTSGTTTSTGTVFTPMYQYTVEPATGIQATVMAGAGPH
jgi:pectate lyase